MKRNLNKDSGFRQRLFEQRGHEIAWIIFLTLRSLPPLSELYSRDSKCHYTAIIITAEYFFIIEE